MSSKGSKLPPKGSRRRVQIVLFTGVVPSNVQQVAAFIFPEGGPVPADMQQVSSAAYSLGSPPIPGVQVVAAMAFSLASPAIPPNLKKMAILPE